MLEIQERIEVDASLPPQHLLPVEDTHPQADLGVRKGWDIDRHPLS